MYLLITKIWLMLSNEQWRNSMIEQLHEQDICDSDGNLYAMSAPSNWELMKKINELVDEVNRLKRKLKED